MERKDESSKGAPSEKTLIIMLLIIVTIGALVLVSDNINDIVEAFS